MVAARCEGVTPPCHASYVATTNQRNKNNGRKDPRAGRRIGSAAPGSRDASRSRTGTPAAASPDTAESLTEAIALLESFVGSFEPGRYSAEDAALLVDRFSRGEHLCATGKALAAKRATETDLHRKDGSRSAAEWLSRKTGESLGASTGSLRLADQMEDHPGLDAALRTGELSQSRARQVAGALTLDPDSSDELVEAAKDKNESNRQLADRCLRAKAKARSGEDALAAYERIRDSRYLRHYTDADGAFRLEGLFTPDAGAKMLAAIKPTRTVLFDEARTLGVRERPEAYEADALVALLTGERRRAVSGGTGSDAHTDLADSDPAGSDPAGSDQADADQTTTTGRSPGLPPPASVHLRVDLEALRRGSLDGDERCEIPGVGPVPLETARSLLGDAILHLVITNGTDIASVAYLGRTIRAPLERALIARDETCVVPGCDVRDGLEIDHRIIPVVENGETALWNLARLCHRHHYLRHHKGFRLEGGPGAWQWLPPEKPPTRTGSTNNPDADDADTSNGSHASGEPDQLFQPD
jgi:hypothetical protein